MKSKPTNTETTKLFIPIENLEVESVIKLGDVIVHPSSDVESVIESFNKVTHKTKNTDEQKAKFAEWYKQDLIKNLGGRAFIEVEWQTEEEGKLIPKDIDPLYEHIKSVIAVLYLLQKQIVGVVSIEHQKFGLKRDLHNSLNYIVALQGEDRSTYSFKREGVMADWTFVDREIKKFPYSLIYTYFDKLLSKDNKSDIEKRILSAIVWLYDAAMDFSHTNRFVKLAIALEVLFASGKNQKSFRLSRFSTLISHLYILNNFHCLCPILESHTAKEYINNVRLLNLPGMCSAYWDLRKWYTIRSEIVHDAKRTVDKKDLTSFEWWTHKLIIATVEIVSKSNIDSLDALETHLEKEYRAYKATWNTK